ncbi:MAG: tetratricopeptide repeat protein [Candidatus Babeliaceae bacterium]|nr:tetratricopeptide repeat protein [Candidatus Babeliaceae bacterium]
MDYIAFLTDRVGKLRGNNPQEPLKEIEIEIEAIRNFWDDAIKHNDLQTIAAVSEPLHRFYQLKGWYDEGEMMFRDAIWMIRSQVRQNPGRQDLRLLLADMLEIQADFTFSLGGAHIAENFYYDALAIKEEILSPDDKSLSALLNNLAFVHHEKKEYDKAEYFYQRALTLSEKSLGSDHIGVAAPLNNLAVLFRDTGNYEQSEALFRRSLAISEKRLGKDHYELIPTLSNIALLYRDRGRFTDAEVLYNRAIEIAEHSLGKGHPGIATTLNNLAELYAKQGNYQRAEVLLEQVLNILERSLPATHPDISKARNNLNAVNSMTTKRKKRGKMTKRLRKKRGL